jgi:hypothetical protein
MTKEMKNNFIHVCFIIDESSSMWTSVSDVRGGFQRIIDEQKANENGTCAISIFRFATTPKEADFIMKDIREVENILTYNPSGCTAMYDGIGVAIDEVGERLAAMPEEERPEKNLIVIMTDGEENSSHSYQPSKIREMIKHQEDKYNWTFLYIGTDISNTQDADRIGIGRKFATTRGKLYKSYDTVNSVMNCYRSASGDALTKGATMDMFLSAEITANNAEYKADTGIDIN